MHITALGRLDPWLSFYCHPPPITHFPKAIERSKKHEGLVPAFFCTDSLIDTRPSAHCVCVEQAHHNASIFVLRLLGTILTTIITMFSYRLRSDAEKLLEETRIARECEGEDFLTGHDGASSNRASLYSYNGGSSSSTIDVTAETTTIMHPYPGCSTPCAPGRMAPVNFATVVHSQIYRCGFPSAEHYDFLRALDLRTIITLVDKDIPEPYVRFIREAGIKHFVCPVTPNKGDHKRSTVRQVAAALNILMDPKNHPVLLHCNKGKHRSGCVTASLRKCLGMGIDDILAEYAQYAGEKARELDVAFIRAFDESQYLFDLRSETLQNSPRSGEVRPIIKPLTPLGRISRPRV